MKKTTKLNAVIILTVILTLTVAFIFFRGGIKEGFGEGCTDQKEVNDIPANAAEACRRISTRAEEIEAEGKAVSDALANIPFYALFNPNNYTAGENKMNDTMRNIIEANLSSCEMTKITSLCEQSSTTGQSNIITTNKECEYCNKYGCDAIGNVQSNTAVSEKSCTIQVAVSALVSKKNSVDAQALAKVFQKAEGLLSGNNNVTSENCNIIDADMSTQRWTEAKNQCIQDSGLLQENTLSKCGNQINNRQINTSEMLQDCVQGTSLRFETNIENNTSVSKELEVSQETSGIDSSMMASLVSGSVSSCFCCIAVLGVLAYFQFGDSSAEPVSLNIAPASALDIVKSAAT